MYKTKEERLSPEFINGELRSLLGLSFPEYVPPQGSPEIPLEGEVYAHRWKDRATGERKRTWHGPGTAAYLRAIRVDHALRRGYQEVFSGDPSLKYGRRQHFTPDQIAALEHEVFTDMRETTAVQPYTQSGIEMNGITRLDNGKHLSINPNHQYIATAHCW